MHREIGANQLKSNSAFRTGIKMWRWVNFQGFFEQLFPKGIGEISLLFSVLFRCVGREPALRCLHPTHVVQAALGSPELPACSSVIAGRAPYVAPVRHFSANISTKFSGGECCFAELRPFPKDKQILPGIIKVIPTFFIIILAINTIMIKPK